MLDEQSVEMLAFEIFCIFSETVTALTMAVQFCAGLTPHQKAAVLIQQ